MGDVVIEVVHMRHHAVCEAALIDRGPCSAMTNYRCLYCHQPVCGRHHRQHELCTIRGKK